MKVEKISSLAQQSFEREREIEDIRLTHETIKPPKPVAVKHTEKAQPKPAQKAVKAQPKQKATPAKAPAKSAPVVAPSEVQLTFKKNLTPREQAVFEHFLNNKNNIVYAKELAQVLDLPRDYVYKYIKNLRAKLNEDALHNASNGGFILNV